VIVIVLLGVILLIGVALALTLGGDGLSAESVDHGDLGLPERPLTADDIAGLRFRTSARGYRMEDVDKALERVAEAMRESPPATNA